MHFKIRGKTHKSSELVFGSFVPPERLPNHEHLLKDQQNQTNDKEIKNKKPNKR